MNFRKTTLTLIFSIALIVRLIYVNQTLHDPIHTTLTFDSKLYSQEAKDLIKNGPLQGDVYILGPLYSFFLAAIYSTTGTGISSVMIIQATLGALACVLVYLIGEMIFDARTALTASLITAFYGPLVFYTAVILTEPILILVNTLLVYLLVKAYMRGKPTDWALAGIALGISAWGKSNILVLVPLLLALNWLQPQGKKARYSALWLLAAVILTIAPITARNMIVGGFAPVTGNFGVNLYTGNNPKATGTFMPLNELIPSSGNAYFVGSNGGLTNPKTILDADPIFKNMALDYITNNPLDWTRLMLRKTMLYLNSYEIPDMEDYEFEKNTGILAFLIPSMTLIAPLAMLGIVLNMKNRKTWPLTLFIIAYSGSFIIFFVKGRFRIALMTALILFAANAIWWLWRSWSTDRKSVLLPAVTLILFMVIVNNHTYRATIEGTGMYNPYNNLGQEYANQGLTDKAIQYYQKAIAYSPGQYEPLNNLGEAYNRIGDYEKAETALRKAIEINPKSPYAHNNLGTTLYNTGRIRESAQEYEKAVEANPYYYTAHSNLGSVYMALNETEKAVKEYETATRINPEDQTVRENLAVAYKTLQTNQQ